MRKIVKIILVIAAAIALALPGTAVFADMEGETGKNNGGNNNSWEDSPPYTPSNPDPENGAIGVGIDTDLSWDGGNPDPGDEVFYYIFFGTDSNPPFVEMIGPYPGNQIRISWDPGTLDYGTHYYWKIYAHDAEGSSAPGPIWDFTTEPLNSPPYTPSNPDPENGAIGVGIDTDLSWTGGDPDGDPVIYDVCFGTTSPPPKVASNITVTVYDPGTLDYETTYYWKIVAWDNHGAYTEGPIWIFTTEEQPNNPPYTPSNPDPENGAIGVDIDTNLSWDGGDPDPGDQVYYGICFGTDPTPPFVETIGPYPAEQTAISWDPGTLDYNTKYYWKIIVWDGQGPVSGPIWNFTTVKEGDNPPTIPIVSGPTAGGLGIEFNFTAVSTDPNEDQIYYMFDWGDSTSTEWLGPFDSGENVTTDHSWVDEGEYEIKVKAKDINEEESSWSEPYTISISKQIELSNLQIGFIYLRTFFANNSFAYVYFLETLGLSVVISDEGLSVETTATDAVDSVTFELIDILWEDQINQEDDNSSDGFSAYFEISTGLFQITVYAYDENGTMIDIDKLDYLVFIDLGSGEESQQIGHIGRMRYRIRERIRDRLLHH